MPNIIVSRRLLLSDSGSFTALANTFFSRVLANGYQMTFSQMKYYNDYLFAPMEKAGHAFHIDRLHIYYSFNSTIARTSLFGATNILATPLNSPVFSALNGYTFVSTSAIDSGFEQANSVYANQNSVGLFSRIDGAGDVNGVWQGREYSPFTNTTWMSQRLATDNKVDWYMNSTAHQASVGNVLFSGNNFLSAQRRNTGDNVIFCSTATNTFTLAVGPFPLPSGTIYDGAGHSGSSLIQGLNSGTIKYAGNCDGYLDIPSVKAILDNFITNMAA